MPKVNAPIYSLNGGEAGEEALARLDLERLQFAGEIYQNALPRVVGSMTIRPGLEHVDYADFGEIEILDGKYSGVDGFAVVLSDEEMRILNGSSFVSRTAVSTAVTNGSFSSFTGWTDASSGAATATVSGGFLLLKGTTQASAVARQTLSVAVGDRNKEHGLRLVVGRGPVDLRIGTTSGGSELLDAVNLMDGVHSLAFTPTGASAYLELTNREARVSTVDSCTIEAAGVVILPTPWTDADLAEKVIRYTQHKDVFYTASTYYQQREIHRRGATSWSIQKFKSDDGPFVIADNDISLTPSQYVDAGGATLTASRPYFDPGMVNRLFRIYQSGQRVEEVFTSDPAEGDYIRISGVDEARRFSYAIGGTWTGTVKLQIATDDGSDNPTSWLTVKSFSTNSASTYTDSDDNVIKYARFVVESGELTSGSISTSITYGGGSQFGICRMIGYTSTTVASIEILSRFYSKKASFKWDYSTWSDYDGWPSAVTRFGGRLYWDNSGLIHGSVPDNFRSYDDLVEGASAPIARSIGADTGNGSRWMLGLGRLNAGTDVSEFSIKSSSFDEPLTADNWFPVEVSTRGCANLPAVKVDGHGIFVQSGGTSIYRIAPDQQGLEYGTNDLTALHERICDGSPVVSFAVQRRPDTVVWFVLANGEVRGLTYEPNENVIGWFRAVTEGDFKNVGVCRGAGRDYVYFAVERDGTKRLELLSQLTECEGGAENCLADAFKRFTATASQTAFSVPHLDGLDVTVWANGVALHDQSNLYTVSGGVVTLPAQPAGTKVVIGLPYDLRWKTTKLAYGAGGGTALFARKKVSKIGLYLLRTMLDGLRVGKDFSSLRKLATVIKGKPVVAGELLSSLDADLMTVSSDWDTDSRVCVEHSSPYPFTAAALVLDVSTNG